MHAGRINVQFEMDNIVLLLVSVMVFMMAFHVYTTERKLMNYKVEQERQLTEGETRCKQEVNKLMEELKNHKVEQGRQLTEGETRCKQEVNKLMKDQETKEFSSFSAYTTYGGILSSAPIKYDKVLTNIGNDYDAGSGKFIAPVTGLYCISFSMMGLHSNRGAYIFLMKNQDECTRLYTEGLGRHEVTSNTVFINLSKDDTVWVKGNAGKTLYAAEPYNMFSGTLIRSGRF